MSQQCILEISWGKRSKGKLSKAANKDWKPTREVFSSGSLLNQVSYLSSFTYLLFPWIVCRNGLEIFAHKSCMEVIIFWYLWSLGSCLLFFITIFYIVVLWRMRLKKKTVQADCGATKGRDLILFCGFPRLALNIRYTRDRLIRLMQHNQTEPRLYFEQGNYTSHIFFTVPNAI